MTRLFTSLLLGLTLAAFPACGGDDDGDDGGDGSDGSDIDAGGDTPDSGGDVEDPDAAADVLPTAAAWCADYESICGYGEDYTYADEADCLDSYDGYDEERQGCVVDHLNFADMAVDDSDDQHDHCSHAAGQAICT